MSEETKQTSTASNAPAEQSASAGATPEALLQQITKLLNTIGERIGKLEQRQVQTEAAIDMLAEMNSKARDCAELHQETIGRLAEGVAKLQKRQGETDLVLKNHTKALCLIPGIALSHTPEANPPASSGSN